MKVHHIGYLVKNIEKALPDFYELGYQNETDIIYDPLRDIDIIFLINGTCRIELVQPKSKTSVVFQTLRKTGNAPYHICYICDNIQSASIQLRQKGFLPTGPAEPAIAIGGNPVCFMFKSASGLIELVEQPES